MLCNCKKSNVGLPKGVFYRKVIIYLKKVLSNRFSNKSNMGSIISKSEPAAQKSDQAEFEQMVEAGIAAIPKRFLRKLDNVAIVIEDEPTPNQKEKLHLRSGWTLFGLYEGVPQTKRGAYYGAVLPDKITIFRKPIIQAASDAKHIQEIVKNTVWHEIAHHFGMNEVEVRRSDARRKSEKNSTN